MSTKVTTPPPPMYYLPARQVMHPITRTEAARILRHCRRRRTVIRLRDGHTYCANANQWSNWTIETRPARPRTDP